MNSPADYLPRASMLLSVLVIVWVIVRTPWRSETQPTPKPTPLTSAQRVWVRDVCVPRYMAGDHGLVWAVRTCRVAAHEMGAWE